MNNNTTKGQTMTTTEKPFLGDFDFLPVRSSIDSGPLPSATSDAFQAASIEAISSLPDDDEVLTIRVAALVWRMEAIRARRQLGPDADVCGRAVMRAVAARLYDAVQ